MRVYSIAIGITSKQEHVEQSLDETTRHMSTTITECLIIFMMTGSPCVQPLTHYDWITHISIDSRGTSHHEPSLITVTTSVALPGFVAPNGLLLIFWR